jgi:hypothetical protein
VEVRAGQPAFLIVSNAAPNGPLATKLAAARLACRCSRRLAKRPVPGGRILPPPQATLLEAAQVAGEVGRSGLTVCHAGRRRRLSGNSPVSCRWLPPARVDSLDHTFRAAELPDLFEQLVVQLQRSAAATVSLPGSRARARPVDGERVRLIVGYSGAGKTSVAGPICAT